jgi:hypothetical protein
MTTAILDIFKSKKGRLTNKFNHLARKCEKLGLTGIDIVWGEEYIWKNKNNLSNLFEEVEFPKLIKKEKPWELDPSESIFNTIISKYKKLWKEVKLINLCPN